MRAKKKNHLELGDGNPHRTRQKRPHIAQEMRDLGQHDLREEMVRGLRPEFADAATGMMEGSHRYQPLYGSHRETIKQGLGTTAPRGGMIG